LLSGLLSTVFMPLHSIINHDSSTKIYLWKISESFDALFSEIILNENSKIRLQSMKSEMHQRGFLSVRKLLQEAGYSDFDLFYDASGKPNLVDENHISISHSHEFATLIISNKPVGIDLEIQKEKILKIAPKFMDSCHLENLSHEDQIKKATVVWGIKEAIFKIKNIEGISFKNHIFEDEFQLKDNKTFAQLRFENKIENFEIHFQEIENYILVYSFEESKEKIRFNEPKST
jgi:4'-phosphopantetheinyl transferase